MARDAEIVSKYHPDVLWFDWWINNPERGAVSEAICGLLLQRSRCLYTGRSASSTINMRLCAPHSAVLDIERGPTPPTSAPSPGKPNIHQRKSWGYIKGDSFKSAGRSFSNWTCVSKNGNLLLNVGPRSDGTIRTRLNKFCETSAAGCKSWRGHLRNSTPRKTFGEGPTKVVEGAFHDTDTASYTADDYRFTAKGTRCTHIELKSPIGKQAVIRSVKLDPSQPGRRLRRLHSSVRPLTCTSNKSRRACTLNSHPECQRICLRIPDHFSGDRGISRGQSSVAFQLGG